jgi:hypothetical protein
VDSHVTSVLRKADVRNRGELLALAVAHEVVDMTAAPPRWTGRACLPVPRTTEAGGPALRSGR